MQESWLCHRYSYIILIYLNTLRFYHAAVAFENCPPKYKAVFAEPKGSTRSQRDQYGRQADDNPLISSGRSGGGGGGSGSGSYNNGNFNNDWNCSFNSDMAAFLRMQNVPVPQPTCLEVIASHSVNQDQLWRLFDIIPGLDYCQITRECSFGYILFKYDFIFLFNIFRWSQN